LGKLDFFKKTIQESLFIIQQNKDFFLAEKFPTEKIISKLCVSVVVTVHQVVICTSGCYCDV